MRNALAMQHRYMKVEAIAELGMPAGATKPSKSHARHGPPCTGAIDAIHRRPHPCQTLGRSGAVKPRSRAAVRRRRRA